MVASVRALWDAMGASIGDETRGGLMVSWADHWVVRVGLFGMTAPDFARLHAELKRSGCLSAMKHADTSCAYVVRRGKATAKGSETKRWVNVSEGNGDFWTISTRPAAHTTVCIYYFRVPKHQQTRSGSKVDPIYDLGR